MKLLVLSIRDRAVAAFMQPFYSASRGAAIRSFGDEVNRAANDNPLNKHPEDYDLYELASFDDATGSFECLKQPEQIAVGKDLVRG